MAEIRIDDRTYPVQVHCQVVQPENAPRLVIVAYQPNETAQNILRVCIQTIQHYTSEPHELWVIDNNSPRENVEWLLQWPDINVVLNHARPLPPEGRSILARFMTRLKGTGWGSYANAIGLEIAVRLINPNSHYLMTLHMDTMPCRTGWLSFLLSKLGDSIAASGVCMQKARTPEGILHVSGYLVDFQVFRRLDLDFMPQMPQYDVGDTVTVALRGAGYDVFACPSTYEEPLLIEKIPISSPLRHMYVNRSFNDNGDIIFLHLARGLAKSVGKYRKTRKTTPEEWIRFAEQCLLA